MSNLVVPIASVFEISYGQTDRQTDRDTDRQTNAGENPIPATSVGEGNNEKYKCRLLEKDLYDPSRSPPMHWE